MQKKIIFLVLFQIIISRPIFTATQIQENLFTQIKTPITYEQIKTNTSNILKAARYALQYFKSGNKKSRDLTTSKFLEKKYISNLEARKTLEFIVKTIEEDQKSKRSKSRILDPNFIKKNFSFIKWNSDQQTANKNHVKLPKWYNHGKLAPEKIKLTSYAIFKRYASYKKTKTHKYALYEISSKDFESKLRLKYTKQKILSGALEKKDFKNHVSPLVWVSRQSLEEALMQGSIMLLMPDGKKRIFNTYKSNGFPFIKKLKTTWRQKKYWFFKEIKKQKSQQQLSSPLTLGGVIFAGDVHSIGLGKIIALKYKNLRTKKDELRLGVLADKGSAFSNNLYQLDFFVGVFNNRKEFKKFIGQFPPAVEAYILKKRT